MESKVVNKSIKDPEIIDLFNKMVGTSDPDPEIIIPKYEKILENANILLNVLSSFIKSPFGIVFNNDYKKGFTEVYNFVENSKKELNDLQLIKNDKIYSGDELSKLNENPEELQKYLESMNLKYKITNLAENYKSLKNCNTIKNMIMTARNLSQSLKLEKDRTRSKTNNLENKENLSSNFILESEGDSLILFGFSSLDFKYIMYNPLMNKEFSKYLLLVLHMIYKKTMNIVKEITSPDIDINQFSEVFVNNISHMKKHIPGCDKAFDAIQESVGLLKENFGEYYKDFISSQNSGIILENFVSDVAKNHKGNISVIAQFRKIVQFYRERVETKIKDPKAKKLFDMLGEHMDIVDEKYAKTNKSSKEELDEKNE